MVDWDSDVNFEWLKGGSDERNRIIENLPVIAMFAFMLLIFIPQIPAFIKPYLIFGGFGLAMVVGGLSEYMLRVKASEYAVLEAIIRPANKKYYLFLDEPKQGVQSELIDKEREWYFTPLDLGEPVEWHDDCGVVSQIEIEGQLSYNKRIHGTPGYVTYKGFPGLRHNNVARVELWEPKTHKGRLDPITMSYVPRLLLNAAPLDYYIEDEPVPLISGQTAQQAEKTANGKTVGELERENIALKIRARTAEQQLIRTKDLSGDAVNELFASRSKTRDIKKLALEDVVEAMHAHSDVNAAAREFKPWSWPKFTTAMAATMIALGFLLMLGINQEFRVAVFANLPIVAFVIAGIAILAYFLKGKVKF